MRNSTIDLECLARDPCFFHLHDRSFWPTRIGYRVSRPEQMSHHFSVPVSYCVTRHTKDNEELRRNTFPGGMVVSEELRQIIEKLQPGYAKFFPVQLEFKDCVADGYSWFIQPYRLVETETFLGGRLGDYVRSLPDAAGDYTVEAPRSKLAGVHWERTDSLKYFFSGEMVRRLEPLILRRENAWLKSLVPVTVIED